MFNLTIDQKEELRRKIMKEVDTRIPIIKNQFNDWKNWPGTWCFADCAVSATDEYLKELQEK